MAAFIYAQMPPESVRVWEQVVSAFPAFLPRQPITVCACEECLDVRANLGNLRWTELLPPALEKCFGALPLLNDDAFYALLPAFIFRALQSPFDADNKYLEWTLYAVCGAYEEDELTTEAARVDRRVRIARFTGEQRMAVREFLLLVVSVTSLDFHHDSVNDALATIWV